jgi:hypothetical protein
MSLATVGFDDFSDIDSDSKYEIKVGLLSSA